MPRTEQDLEFRDAAILLAWEQCLREHGLQGAIGCAHLAVEAADALAAERNNNEPAA